MTRHAKAVGALGLGAWLLAAAPAGVRSQPTTAPEPGAAEEPHAPPVDSLVALALARAPAIAAQRARTAAARERIGPAGALQDPLLEVSLQDAGFPDYTVGEDEMSMIGIDLRQPLPFPGKRGARRRAASAEATESDAVLRAIESRVATDVRSNYARLYAVDRTRTALRSARALLRLLETTTAARYAAGKTELEASIKAQLELSRVDERMADLLADRRAVLAELNRDLDRPADTALGAVDSLPSVEPPAGEWQARAVENAPMVLAARAAAAAAEFRLAMQRSERKPDLLVGGEYGIRSPLDPVVTFRVGAELPLWRGGRQGPIVRAAEHELVAAQAELRHAEAEARTEAERLAADWERSDEQVRRYREAILPQSRTAFEAARSSYEAGRGDFSTVIEDFGLWLEAQQQLASREADRFAARARLEALVTPPAAGSGGAGEGSR